MGRGRTLSHRVLFNRKDSDVVRDGYGNAMSKFEPLFSVWGNVRETTGKEGVVAGSVENHRTATIRVRSSSQTRSITEADQAVARGETWNIRGIAHADDRGRFLDLFVEAGVAQ